MRGDGQRLVLVVDAQDHRKVSTAAFCTTSPSVELLTQEVPRLACRLLGQDQSLLLAELGWRKLRRLLGRGSDSITNSLEGRLVVRAEKVSQTCVRYELRYTLRAGIRAYYSR